MLAIDIQGSWKMLKVSNSPVIMFRPPSRGQWAWLHKGSLASSHQELLVARTVFFFYLLSSRQTFVNAQYRGQGPKPAWTWATNSIQKPERKSHHGLPPLWNDCSSPHPTCPWKASSSSSLSRKPPLITQCGAALLSLTVQTTDFMQNLQISLTQQICLVNVEVVIKNWTEIYHFWRQPGFQWEGLGFRSRSRPQCLSSFCCLLLFTLPQMALDYVKLISDAREAPFCSLRGPCGHVQGLLRQSSPDRARRSGPVCLPLTASLGVCGTGFHRESSLCLLAQPVQCSQTCFSRAQYFMTKTALDGSSAPTLLYDFG